MPIPNPRALYGRFIVARVKDEVFAVQAGENCSSSISTRLAQELGLSYQFRDASIVIEVVAKKVAMVIGVSMAQEEELILGTDFLYLLDYWA